jgi:hypothetical protein
VKVSTSSADRLTIWLCAVPSQPRTRSVSRAQVRGYAAKAEEYLEAAEASLADGRHIAATSLAVHAGISAGDAICGARTGRRSADQDHARSVALLGEAGPDGKAAARQLGRLLPLKTRAEYEPDEVPKSVATKAVRAATQIAAITRRTVAIT